VPDQPLDTVSSALEHSPDLVLPTLLECDLDTSKSAVGNSRQAGLVHFDALKHLNIAWKQTLPIEPPPRSQCIKSLLRRPTTNHNFIDFQYATARTRGLLHEVPVIRKKH
jgi:hypothetical protein